MSNADEARKVLWSRDLATAKSALDRINVLSESDQALLLRELLGHPRWEIRKAASSALAMLPPGAALPRLKEALADPDPHAQYWAVQVLPDFGEPGLLALVGAAGSVKGELLTFVVRALGRVPSPLTVKPLVEALDAADRGVREEAASALIANQQFALAAVKNLLNAGTHHQRFWSFKILARVMGTKAIEPLAKILLTPPDPGGQDDARPYALAALSDMKHPKVIAPLLRALRSDSTVLRAEAGEALVQQGEMAVPFLREELVRAPASARGRVMRILREILGTGALPLLAPFLDARDRGDRHAAISTIGQIPDAQAARTLILGFTDDAWVVQKTAADALAALGQTAVRPLIDNLASENELSVAWTLETLGRLASEVAVPFVARALEHPARDVRHRAVDALVSTGSEPCAEELVKAFANRMWSARLRASEGLARMGPVAISALLAHVGDPDEDVAYWTMKTLGEFSGDVRPQGLASAADEIARAPADLRDRLRMRLKAQAPEDLVKFLSTGDVSAARMLDLPIPTPEQRHSKSMKIPAGARLSSRREPDALFFDLASPAVYPATFDELLLHAQKMGASDLHLKVCEPPILRIHGTLARTSFPPLSSGATSALFSSALTETQKRRFTEDFQLDLSYEVTDGCRFRLNIYKQSGGLEAACRYIDPAIPDFKRLQLPERTLTRIASHPDGMILVTGPTGSGKSTTTASMIDFINHTFARNILSIEDPIEYKHQNVLSYVSYREVGVDVHSFPMGLRGALREDPDVILIGELRDRETISTALTLAGTGHLVLSTFHTFNCTQTVEQISDFFPSDQQDHIRKQFASVIRAIISQKLFLRTDGRGRLPAYEILTGTSAVRNLIRDGSTHQVHTIMQASAEEGMVTFDSSLAELVAKRIIAYEDALPYMMDAQALKRPPPPGRTADRLPGRPPR